ncbi:hypothetical protein [Nocardia testacea]|uniref:hypothetical protein n=1 Tax=Nocardia testacea TaxID=248551 RepID=UPI003409311E
MPYCNSEFQRLEDLEAIRDPTARYADAINKGWNGKTVDLDAVAQVFAGREPGEP